MPYNSPYANPPVRSPSIGVSPFTNSVGEKVDTVKVNSNGLNLGNLTSGFDELMNSEYFNPAVGWRKWFDNSEEAAQAQFLRDTASAREAMQFSEEQAELDRQFQQNSAKTAMDFEAREAQKNRDWQTMMANSAYTRAVADMKNSGLNPVLAAYANGSAVPSGGVASGFSASGSRATGTKANSSKADKEDGLLSAAISVLAAIFLKKFV